MVNRFRTLWAVPSHSSKAPFPHIPAWMTPLNARETGNYPCFLGSIAGRTPPMGKGEKDGFLPIRTVVMKKILTFIENQSIFSVKTAFIPVTNIFSGDTP